MSISTERDGCSFNACKRKLKLTAFPCKCGQRYCDKHRIPEDHSCSFNFKREQQDLLNKYMGERIKNDQLEGRRI
jgi:hypothetical protein